MKKSIICVAAIAALIATGCKGKEGRIVVNSDRPVELTSKNDSLSWALGFAMAQNMAVPGIDINRELMLQAIVTTLDSKQQPMTEHQTMRLLTELEGQASLNRHMASQASKEELAKREAPYFEQLMRDNPNVKKSDKGFYYEVLKEGSGKPGEIGQVVVFDYKGMFTNGQVFDQTYGNREPITHVISQSIFPGLFEGFQIMNKGSHYRFYFPSQMGFGQRGTDNIPPNTIIIYEVEVHDIRD